jgi:hypothetical protein
MSLGKRSLSEIEGEWLAIKEEEDRLMGMPTKNDADVKNKRKLVMANKEKMIQVESLISGQLLSSKKRSADRSEIKILQKEWETAKKEENRIFKIITTNRCELEFKKTLAKDTAMKLYAIEKKICETNKENSNFSGSH